MKIRKATKKDLRKIAKIMMTEFAKPPFKDKASLNAVLKSLKFYMKIGKTYVSIMEKRIVGVVVFKIEQYWEGPVIIIEDLVVNKKYQKQGIGKKLMAFTESYGKKRKVKTSYFETHKKSNAVKFYQKYGYKLDKNYVSMEKN